MDDTRRYPDEPSVCRDDQWRESIDWPVVCLACAGLVGVSLCLAGVIWLTVQWMTR